MQLKSEAEKIEVNGKKILHTSTPTISNKTAYSCYFEAQLDFKNFGKNRKKHNIICNQQLLKQLEEFTKEGIQFFLEATNEELINNICLSPHKSPHDLLVWEHCHTSTVFDGRAIYTLANT